ncbi:MAG: hypothetical protein Q9196_007327 [Gyalolechia fulgens]
MKSLQTYDAEDYSFTFTRIQSLISDLLRVKSNPIPCEFCIIGLLHEIAGNLNKLLTYGPSSAIAQELTDLKHLTQISRQLLQIDEEAITSAVWHLMEQKVKSLSNSPLARPQDRMSMSVRDGRIADRGFTPRRHDKRSRPTLDADIAERALTQQRSPPRPSGFDLVVIERTPTEQSPVPKPSGFRFDVVEKMPNQQLLQPKSPSFDFDVVERNPNRQPTAPRPLGSNLGLVGSTSGQRPWAPRSSGIEYSIVDRTSNQQPAAPRPPRYEFAVVERVPNQQPSAPAASGALEQAGENLRAVGTELL